jgi:hypothetical protein
MIPPPAYEAGRFYFTAAAIKIGEAGRKGFVKSYGQDWAKRKRKPG